MIFTETRIPGAFVIDLERREDERGYFARAFCREEFTEHGLDAHVESCNIAWNAKKGTLRGLHYQRPPHTEAKLVRCTHGSIFDVVVDLREGSPTFTQWFGTVLSRSNGQMFYIPKGCAHGYQVLEDDTEVTYLVSAAYRPEVEGGALWNDDAFGVSWPLSDPILSPRDRAFPSFNGEGIAVADHFSS